MAHLGKKQQKTYEKGKKTQVIHFFKSACLIQDPLIDVGERSEGVDRSGHALKVNLFVCKLMPTVTDDGNGFELFVPSV